MRMERLGVDRVVGSEGPTEKAVFRGAELLEDGEGGEGWWW